MKDPQTEILMSWTKWQKEAWAGYVKEPSGPFPGLSGIACPTYEMVKKKKVSCGNNMTNTNALIQCGSEPRRIMHCSKCDAWMCRLLGVHGELSIGRKWWLNASVWYLVLYIASTRTKL